MSQRILLLNCGSSSIKYQLLDPNVGVPEAVGLVERIGLEIGHITHEVGDQEFKEARAFANHTDSVAAVVKMFEDHGPTIHDVVAVGHRTVHGGDKFVESTLIDDEVIAKLVELSDLAPLHNPPGIAGIEAAMSILPDVPHVAIFDTAFFSTLPPEAYTYAIHHDTAQRLGVRRYGFHGTSHSYVSKKAAEFLGRPLESLKTIVCHLGNGASISAVDGGIAVDTSMGLTPLEGIVMGTRSGDVDPGLHKYLMRTGMTIDEVDTLLNKKSGMDGMCGHSDMRDVSAAIDAGDELAKLAMDVYIHRLLKYIGSYVAVLGGIDALVFTAGVGENAADVRQMVIDRLATLGYKLDYEKNRIRSKEPREISTPDSRAHILVVPTNEELAMAQETATVIAR